MVYVACRRRWWLIKIGWFSRLLEYWFGNSGPQMGNIIKQCAFHVDVYQSASPRHSWVPPTWNILKHPEHHGITRFLNTFLFSSNLATFCEIDSASFASAAAALSCPGYKMGCSAASSAAVPLADLATREESIWPSQAFDVWRHWFVSALTTG